MTATTSDVIVAATGESVMEKNTGRRESPTRAEIARLAFFHYELNGRKDGHDIDDWLLAERELAHHYE